MEINRVRDNKTRILLEILEIFINHILYLRDVYPQRIFEKRRAYNTPVYISTFPPLNEYLAKVLTTIKDLLNKSDENGDDLQSIELVFYKIDNEPLESYSFDLVQEGNQSALSNKDDEFLLRFEEKVRSALYMLSERLKPSRKLPSDTRFKILLHTNQSAFTHLTQNPHHQDFPWLQNPMEEEIDSRKDISILPLSSFDGLGIQILAQIRR